MIDTGRPTARRHILVALMSVALLAACSNEPAPPARSLDDPQFAAEVAAAVANREVSKACGYDDGKALRDGVEKSQAEIDAIDIVVAAVGEKAAVADQLKVVLALEKLWTVLPDAFSVRQKVGGDDLDYTTTRAAVSPKLKAVLDGVHVEPLKEARDRRVKARAVDQQAVQRCAEALTKLRDAEARKNEADLEKRAQQAKP